MEILNASVFKRIFYLLLISASAFLSFHFSSLPAKSWVVLSVVLLGFVTVDSSINRITRVALIGCIAAMVTLVVGLSSKWHPLSVSLISGITFFCAFLGDRYPTLTYPAFIINFCALLAVLNAVSISVSMDQAFLILCATIIVIVTRLLFIVFSTKLASFRSWMVTALHHLIELDTEIFSCFLDPLYSKQLYVYERRIHIQKNKFSQTMIYLRSLQQQLNQEDKDKMEALLTDLEAVHDNIIDCSQLRHRVSDHTIFALCAEELRAIVDAINTELALFMRLLTKKQRSKADQTGKLTAAIKRFEESYFSILQVTSREPLVFLLFIASLKDLNEKFAITFYRSDRLRQE